MCLQYRTKNSILLQRTAKLYVCPAIRSEDLYFMHFLSVRLRYSTAISGRTVRKLMRAGECKKNIYVFVKGEIRQKKIQAARKFPTPSSRFSPLPAFLTVRMR